MSASADRRVAPIEGSSAAVPHTLTLELIRDRAGFDALEAEWNGLFERAGKPHQVFQTFNWCWHWANHFLDESGGGKVALAIVTGQRDGRMVMLWPLVVERQGGLIQISWLGEPVSQYGDVIVEDGFDTEADLLAAWDFIKREIAPDVARLRKVRGDAAIAPLIGHVSALATQKLVAPFIDIKKAKTFEEYEERFSPRARKNRRRLAKRLSEMGALAFARDREGEAARSRARIAIALKRDWLASRGLVSPALTDARTTAFFSDITEGEQRTAGAIVTGLTVKDETAAVEIAFQCKGHFALHIIVFNLKYEKASAGVVLLEKGIRDAFAEGFHTFDFLAPGDTYKLDWADETIAVTDWAIPLTLAGKAYAHVYLGLIRPRAKAALTKMPSALRRMMASSYMMTLA